MAKIYLNQADRGACSYYRARLPWKHCHADLAKDGIELVLSETLDTTDDYSAYIFHRVITPQFLPVFEYLKAKGKRIVIELDDDMWNVPAWNPASRVFGQEQLDTLDRTLDLADQIWVSTQSLSEVVNRPDKTKVLPNLIDPADYSPAWRYDGDPVKIIWAGSIHHDADLDVLVPVVEEIIRRHDEKVQFVFFGHWPERLSKWVRIKYTNLATGVPRSDLAGSLAFVDAVDLSEYPETLCGLGADIGLCPLVDCKFNYSKSGIKAMEYALAGAVPVATYMAPYTGIAPHHVAPTNKPEDWIVALDGLIRDREGREWSLGRTHEWVLAEHSWESYRRNIWLDAFRGLV